MFYIERFNSNDDFCKLVAYAVLNFKIYILHLQVCKA